jgi:hypothetical protein
MGPLPWKSQMPTKFGTQLHAINGSPKACVLSTCVLKAENLGTMILQGYLDGDIGLYSK